MLSGDPNTAPSQGHWFPWELSAGINRVRHTALLHKACPVPPTPSQDSSVAKRHIKRASQSPRGTDSLTCARAHARVCVCMCVCVCVCRLPSWLSGKESACNARDTEYMSSIPGLARSPGGGLSNPLQCSCLENPMNRETWWATVHKAAKIWA